MLLGWLVTWHSALQIPSKLCCNHAEVHWLTKLIAYICNSGNI